MRAGDAARLRSRFAERSSSGTAKRAKPPFPLLHIDTTWKFAGADSNIICIRWRMTGSVSRCSFSASVLLDHGCT
jgi:hypothetical protein